VFKLIYYWEKVKTKDRMLSAFINSGYISKWLQKRIEPMPAPTRGVLWITTSIQSTSLVGAGMGFESHSQLFLLSW